MRSQARGSAQAEVRAKMRECGQLAGTAGAPGIALSVPRPLARLRGRVVGRAGAPTQRGALRVRRRGARVLGAVVVATVVARLGRGRSRDRQQQRRQCQDISGSSAAHLSLRFGDRSIGRLKGNRGARITRGYKSSKYAPSHKHRHLADFPPVSPAGRRVRERWTHELLQWGAAEVSSGVPRPPPADDREDRIFLDLRGTKAARSG